MYDRKVRMAEKSSDIQKNFQNYFREIRRKYLTGDFTEITLRTPLENLIENLNKDYNLIQEPKRMRKVGAPDFKVYLRSVKMGFIETKDLGSNLDKELESEQIQKYKSGINNLILTNYCRFILIREDQNIFDFNLFDVSNLDDSKFKVSDEIVDRFMKMITTFFDYDYVPKITTAKELAMILSRKAKLLKDLIEEQLEKDISRIEKNETASSVYDFYGSIKELLRDVSIDDCADAYSQTITYGLFLSRIYCKDSIDRDTAMLYIPKRVGIIKRIFINISGDSVPSNISWIIDEIVDILNNSDINRILSEIDFRGKKDRDPFTFFYEDFLSEYDPKKRKSLGIYYTPRPVVSFIVNSINGILKKDFGKLIGFADDDVTVLDPAVGTGTFLWLAYILTLVELKNKGLSGLIRKKIEDHILRDFYGLEILITPYIISHLKLSLALRKWHYEMKDDDRIQVYLANTLEPFESHGLIPFMREITRESKIANELKLKKKILVITGNPPYRGSSANKGKWIKDLLKKGYQHKDGTKDYGYYQVDGKPLDERNPKWLQDDYVKFIRFTQWKIDKAGEGIGGLVTNHSYLDNPTFRGMRQSLIKSFNRIYVLNLHGSILKRRKAPDGRRDENVFDIRPGVAISIFVKDKKHKDTKVFYADLFGTREEKFFWLDRNTIRTVKWQELKPKSPYHFFVPKDKQLFQEYVNFPRLDQIFKHYSLSIQTHRDSFVMDFDKEVLTKRIAILGDMSVSDETIRKTHSLKDTSGWKLDEARKSINKIENWSVLISKILYRPFDNRWLFYHKSMVDRMRNDIMKNMDHPNIALLVSKHLSIPKFSHVFVSDIISESCVVSNKTKEQNYHFPLYIYVENQKMPNINEEVLKMLNERYETEPTAEEMFCYVYAILHSKKYREKYAEPLQFDFPRIPFPRTYTEFMNRCQFGSNLVNLHLMKTKLQTETKFDIQGSNIVKFVKYKDQKLHINSDQFFDGIPEEVWNFYIGSYQVLDKWLKSRRNRELTSSEIEEFLQIVEIIKKTVEFMAKIDQFVR